MLGDVCCYLMDYLQRECTATSLCLTFDITRGELNDCLMKLRSMGVQLRCNYYDNGEVSYKIIRMKKQEPVNNNEFINLKLANDSLRLNCVAISDLHYGNSLARVDLVDKLFDYCKRNNIHTIFCCGDFIDGTYTKGRQDIANVYAQMEYFIKNYPRCDDIVTFGVGGDHDYSALSMFGLNALVGILNHRSDVVVPDFNNVLVRVKRDEILLHHKIRKYSPIYGGAASVFLRGHSHAYSSRMIDSCFLDLSVPSLSDVCNSIPSFIEMNISFKKQHVKEILVKHLGYKDDKFVLLAENNFVFLDKNRNYNNLIYFDDNHGGFKKKVVSDDMNFKSHKNLENKKKRRVKSNRRGSY